MALWRHGPKVGASVSAAAYSLTGARGVNILYISLP